jgi:DoxX-like family
MIGHGRSFDHFSRRHTVAAASGRIVWVGRVISILASLLFVMSSLMKMKGGAEVMQGMAHLGLPEVLVRPLAILEIACVAIYLIPATSVLGAILLAGYIGGAICTHLRVGDPFFVQIVLGICVWLGLYLREPRLKDLVPLRRRT